MGRRSSPLSKTRVTPFTPDHAGRRRPGSRSSDIGIADWVDAVVAEIDAIDGAGGGRRPQRRRQRRLGCGRRAPRPRGPRRLRRHRSAAGRARASPSSTSSTASSRSPAGTRSTSPTCRTSTTRPRTPRPRAHASVPARVPTDPIRARRRAALRRARHAAVGRDVGGGAPRPARTVGSVGGEFGAIEDAEVVKLGTGPLAAVLEARCPRPRTRRGCAPADACCQVAEPGQRRELSDPCRDRRRRG